MERDAWSTRTVTFFKVSTKVGSRKERDLTYGTMVLLIMGNGLTMKSKGWAASSARTKPMTANFQKANSLRKLKLAN